MLSRERRARAEPRGSESCLPLEGARRPEIRQRLSVPAPRGGAPPPAALTVPAALALLANQANPGRLLPRPRQVGACPWRAAAPAPPPCSSSVPHAGQCLRALTGPRGSLPDDPAVCLFSARPGFALLGRTPGRTGHRDSQGSSEKHSPRVLMCAGCRCGQKSVPVDRGSLPARVCLHSPVTGKASDTTPGAAPSAPRPPKYQARGHIKDVGREPSLGQGPLKLHPWKGPLCNHRQVTPSLGA